MGMQLVEVIEVGAGGAASIEFTSIPQDGVDLVCVMSLSGNFATVPGASYAKITFNADTGTNYNWLFLYGTGSTTASFSASSTTSSRTPWIENDNSGDFGSMSCYISNYASTATKSISYDGVTEQNATAAQQTLIAGNYTGSSGISSMLIEPVQATLFSQYSTASLYKITAD